MKLIVCVSALVALFCSAILCSILLGALIGHFTSGIVGLFCIIPLSGVLLFFVSRLARYFSGPANQAHP